MKERLNQAINYAIESEYRTWREVEEMGKKLRSCKNICLFGLGKFYRDLIEKDIIKAHFGQNMVINYVCDNDMKKHNKLFQTNIPDVRCVSVEELTKLEDLIVLVTIGESEPILKQLRGLGIECYPFGMYFLREYDECYTGEWFEANRAKILQVYELLEDDYSKEVYTEVICNRIAPHLAKRSFESMKEENEYFRTGLINFRPEEECVVECGSYVGDSLEDYMRTFDNKVKNYYCFEMDENIANVCQKTIDKYHNENIHLIRAGVSDENKVIQLAKTGSLISSSTQKSAEEYIEAKIVKIDDCLSNKEVTFIKMDIEGEEIRALKGAEKIIREQKPNMSISAYHFLNDLWEIPLLIYSYDNNYKLYLRHHSTTVWDTDCYAVME